MGRFTGKTIAVGVGGGIAAYKACELVRALVKEDAAEVRVVMTEAATRFVTPLTLQALARRPVLSDLLDPAQDSAYGHLAVARGLDLFIVLPATADLLARIRAGMANDAVTTTLLAARCPVLLAPAMNTAMWEHPVTAQNVAALAAIPQFQLVGPESGALADGDVGAGRLAELETILAAAARMLAKKDLAGKRVLITAGPTREAIDPVRYLTNRSSGKMGYALAQAALARGAAVTLISGPVSLTPPGGATVRQVTTAQEMLRATLAALPGTQVVIASAAVADYRPAQVAPQKLKKSDAAETLQLERTPDVLAEASRAAGTGLQRPLFVGFAAETEALLAHAGEKLQKKNLDLVVANDVSRTDRGFEVNHNAATLLFRDGSSEAVPLQSKDALADLVLDRVVALLTRRG
jgi:phosphopantothenoylcysteine decarboxylase/phosphopantothenate--cysteine ligase